VRALILETGRTRAALAGARALHRAGWRVGIGSPLRGLATRSRAVERWHPLPAPEEGGEPYLEAVWDAVRSGRYTLVFAAGDAELLLVAEGRDQLGATVPHPSHGVLLRGLDKLELMQTAERVGVAVPRTWRPSDGFGAKWPVVVKPRFKLADVEEGHGWRLGTQVAHDADEVRGCVEDIERAGVEAVLQQHLVGRLVAWSGVLDGTSEVLAEVQQEASQLWPTSGGVSARAVTVPVGEEIGGGARALLAELGWNGLVQLQFIVGADGRPRLIDLNPRFYGSLALAIGAGVNLPAVAAASATGGRPSVPAARVGARYQWLVGDLQAQLADERGRVAALLSTLRWGIGAHHSVWSARDPAPAAWYLGSLLRRLAARGRS
jgi:predicted ATP-grasp superfamily ATP-dependent carboligase